MEVKDRVIVVEGSGVTVAFTSGDRRYKLSIPIAPTALFSSMLLYIERKLEAVTVKDPALEEIHEGETPKMDKPKSTGKGKNRKNA